MNNIIHLAFRCLRPLTFAFLLTALPTALYASEIDDLKKAMAIQQADIRNLKLALTEAKADIIKSQKEIVRISGEVETSKKTMTSDFQTNANAASSLTSLNERFAGLSCNAERCTFTKPVMIDFGSEDFNIHIPESWGAKQPFVACSKKRQHCEALLTWPKL